MPVLTPERTQEEIQPLENGEHLEADEFLRRYEAMPELKKAELIQGIVYMGSPVRMDRHGRQDNMLQGWTAVYCSATPGVESGANSTVLLRQGDVPQPDIILQLLPEYGGQSRVDQNGYILGAPELVVEIAASSSAIDAHEKRISYLQAGAREYLLWRTVDAELNWWFSDAGEFHPLPADANGIIRSRVFPGLWLDRAALLKMDRAGVMHQLQAGLQGPEHRAFVQSLGARKQQ